VDFLFIIHLFSNDKKLNGWREFKAAGFSGWFYLPLANIEESAHEAKSLQ
jgi:hypothetical protein